jgi:hypothetical protein
MNTFEEARREGMLRYRAKKLGLMLVKSRAREWNYNNQQGWMVVIASLNAVAQGSNFELNLDDVDEYLTSMETVN